MWVVVHFEERKDGKVQAMSAILVLLRNIERWVSVLITSSAEKLALIYKIKRSLTRKQ
jgi:hypothetical protein